MRRRAFVCGVVGWLVVGLLANGAVAAIRLPKIIGDNMVLQRGRPVPIWGWAGKGQTVTVRFAGQSVSTKADADGRWKVTLARLEPGGPYEMAIQSPSQSRTLKNVLVGEVWICSGQSNMGMGVKECNHAEAEIAAANYPQIRLFTVQRLGAPGHTWVPCNPKTIEDADKRGFSAAAYYFGRALFRELNIPIGLVNSSFGGTPAEAWTSRKALDSEPVLKGLKRGELYDAMIAPLMPYVIRGVIWYQGESNVGRAAQYRVLFPTLIRNWRTDWGQGDFPFYFAQLAPLRHKNPGEIAELRDAQLLTLKTVPNTGMVVTTDIGDVNNVHPRNKQEVGRRFALWALNKDYGRQVVYSGPIYQSMTVDGNKVRVTFQHVDGGLKSTDNKPLSHFTIAGADRKFVPALAVIDGRTIVVSSPRVAQPEAVRFAWRNDAEPNFVNAAGLPASPFRTDFWSDATDPL